MLTQFYNVAQIWWQWMSSMFWQASLLILFVTVIDMAIRKWAWPQVRYVLWGLVFLKLIIPPTWQMPTSILSWIKPGIENQISIQIETGNMNAEHSQELDSITSAQNPSIKTSDNALPLWQSVLFLTWVAGMLSFGLALSIKMIRLRRRCGDSDSRRLPEWFHELLVSTTERMKLKKIPAVVFSEKASGPAVFGLFRPVLLLPEGYIETLSKQQTRHVLLHELCHLKRGDLLLHWFSLILQIIYWFNPLLLWTRRQMRHVCEICCDLSVAGILREKTLAYRSTLLTNARSLLSETVDSSMGFLGIFEDPFRLVSRLKWLEKNTWEKPGQKTAAAIFTALVMIIFVMPMNGLSQSAAPNKNFPAQPGAPAEVESEQIQTSDTPRPQFLIEVMILEVTGDTDFDIGCQEEEEKDRDETSFAICDGITIEGEFYPDMETASEGLSNMPDVKILAMPKIATLDNMTATLKQGGEVRYPPGSANTVDLGLLLEITPQLHEDGLILQDIHLEITQMTDGRIIPRELEKRIFVEEGMTLAIDGLLSSEPTSSAPDEESSWLILLLTCSEIPDGSVPYDRLLSQAEGIPEKSANESGPEEKETSEHAIKNSSENNDEVFQMEEVDRQPRVVRGLQPQYLAKQDNITGKIYLKFVVDVDGNAREA